MPRDGHAVVHLGFEVRVELALSEGERLALDEGAEIYVRPSRMQTFGARAA